MSREAWRIAALLLPGCSMNTGRFEFPDTTGESAAPGDDDDADGDGVANLLEYAQGTDPTLISDSAKATIGFDTEGRVTVGFSWMAEDRALVPQLESSNGLTVWGVLEIDLVLKNGRLTTTLVIEDARTSLGCVSRLLHRALSSTATKSHRCGSVWPFSCISTA